MSRALSIVIPAYREAERLGLTLNRLLLWIEPRTRYHPFEILVVDDGSDDGTSAVAEAFSDRGVRVLKLPENRGKGAAVRAGVLASSGAVVLITDADLSTPVGELVRLEARLPEAPLILGSRAVRGAHLTRRQPRYREWMGKAFNKLIRLLGVGGIADTQCGFKLIEGGVARELFDRVVTPGFAFDVELVWLARREGHCVVEVGVEWENSPASRVRPLVDSPRMIADIVRFRRAHRRRERPPAA